MASEATWWWIVRQAFDIPDIVGDGLAMDAIAEEVAHAVPAATAEVPSDAPHAVALGIEQTRNEIRVAARRFVRRICSVGAQGELDGLLVPRGSTGAHDWLLNRINQGEPLIADDRALIERALDVVVAWIKKHPHLPDALREPSAPPT
jgi:hypothetical protein